MANGTWKAWRAQNHAVYGERHPLGYNQGGEPAGIRTMTPADIRKFLFWAATQGQAGKYTAPLRFVPIPKPVLVVAEKAIKKIQS